MIHTLGAHLSIAGGHAKALHSIIEKGGNALQIFSASPRGWNLVKLEDETIENFVKEAKKLNISPIYFHASYLLNMADDGRIGQLSRQLLVHELKLAVKMGVKGSIIHLGSFKSENPFDENNPHENYSILIKNCQEVLEKIPSESLFIIENAGNKKICQSLDELARIVKDLNDPRVKVCLDTCHLHAAGYDLTTKEKFDEFITNFDKKIGLDRLEVIHMNDSKDSFNSSRDRHENIGEGQVGIDVFKFLLNDARTREKAFIIETPGFDDKGPDKKNLDIVKSLVEK